MEDKSYKGVRQPTSLDKQVDPDYIFAQQFLKALDLDKNGRTTREEFLKVVQNNLDEIAGLARGIALCVRLIIEDKNRDGIIDVEEALKVFNPSRK